MSKKINRKRRFRSVIPLDKCPSCKVHFSKHRTKVIYKDFVECTACGHMWILVRDDVYAFWDYNGVLKRRQGKAKGKKLGGDF